MESSLFIVIARLFNIDTNLVSVNYKDHNSKEFASFTRPLIADDFQIFKLFKKLLEVSALLACVRHQSYFYPKHLRLFLSIYHKPRLHNSTAIK